jgi:clan AA aspartic protease
MGEVRVRVELVNSVDEGLVRRGLLNPDQVRKYTADALVDTGSVTCVLPIHVVQQLGLAIVGKGRDEYANGYEETVDLTEPVGFAIDGRRATEEALVLGSEVLIGQTVLERMDMLVDPVNQRVVPNPAHPDQPVLKVK